jgi:hypothetical protein
VYVVECLNGGHTAREPGYWLSMSRPTLTMKQAEDLASIYRGYAPHRRFRLRSTDTGETYEISPVAVVRTGSWLRRFLETLRGRVPS